MGFFDDDEDPFDSLVREMLGRSSRGSRGRRSRIIEGEDDERVIDVIETDDAVYLLFEMPGYTEEDVEVSVSDSIIKISAKKSNTEDIKDYLAQKLSGGLQFKRSLPEYINTKKVSHTVRNGILEVMFDKLKRAR